MDKKKSDAVSELLLMIGFLEDSGYDCIVKIITSAWEAADVNLSGYDEYVSAVVSWTKLPKRKIVSDINDAIYHAWGAGRGYIIEHMTGYSSQTAGKQKPLPESVDFMRRIVSHLIFCEENGIDEVELAKEIREITNSQNRQANSETDRILGYAVMFFKAKGESDSSIEKNLQELRDIITERSAAEAEFVLKKFRSEACQTVVFGDIIIPSRYNNMKISELAHENKVTGTKLANALEYGGIRYIKDLFGKTKEYLINNIRGFGQKLYDELVAALKRTVCQ